MQTFRIMIPLGDALGYIITASVLFLFAIFVGGYFVVSFISQVLGHPKEQVLSVGHSILDDPTLSPPTQDSEDLPKAA